MTAIASTALDPVSGRLRRDAQAEAARIRSAARDEAEAILRQARHDAAAVLAAATAAAAAAAEPLTAAQVRTARETARAAVLGAQRAAYEELRRRVGAGVAEVAAQPGYDRLIQRCTSLARTEAGPDAQVTIAPGGGIVARAAGVLVDCSLPRLADLAVIRLGSAIRELWA
jgi:vacuolar-type H+-ATPase subunit E/Vma4